MVGTPCPSRITVTLAERPATFTLPSSWGRAECATEYSHANPPRAAIRMAIRKKATTREGLRRRRGVQTGLVMVAMIKVKFRFYEVAARETNLDIRTTWHGCSDAVC